MNTQRPLPVAEPTSRAPSLSEGSLPPLDEQAAKSVMSKSAKVRVIDAGMNPPRTCELG